MLSFRLLVVDDYEPFRRLVCSMLEQMADFHVIGQASDGFEAIQKAQELKPNIILLDIALPKLNGFEVAKRIAEVTPDAKILFLSQESSSDVVGEALRLGALGYVHKSRVQSDLLTAIEAVLDGKRFVSSSLKGWESKESAPDPTPQPHEILIYSDEVVLLESFTRFVAAALKAESSAIVIATKSHLDYLCQALKADGLDVDGAIQQGSYISVDLADMPSTFMVTGWPDLVRSFEAAYKAAKAEHPCVALCGECAGRLWAQGHVDAAIRLEQLCDDLAKTRDVHILCAYPASTVRDKKHEDAFNRICADHSAVHSR
jgi:DNA-binding NarL/FixJ family response regulator